MPKQQQQQQQTTPHPHHHHHHHHGRNHRRAIEHLVNKMVKVEEPQDRWSLISLVNSAGRNVELKFVDTMRRQYEFSVDSFQIVLDTLLAFCSFFSLPITANFYPTVVGESMYGNFTESLVHLHHRLIVTKNPEEIRGGGLLKYISLLVRDYAPIDEDTITLLEPYMCTRFLIDFIYQDRHRDKLTNYLETHFEEDTLTKYNFLIVLQAT
ncbi:PREDICTED: protein FAM46C-like, partial [Rhagoletis zephyria]|uniref:protein FAM46C-like n=1 Tax=Rhagoletis zephyria TaxID=28612 RepID=UPI0008112F1E